MSCRAAVYIDGFNFYHALDGLARPHLKWLDHSKLARLLVAGRRETIVRIVFCTAVRKDKPEKRERHWVYLKALQGAGVELLVGHFSKEKRSCWNCRDSWEHPTEKEGDVSLALAVIDDAYRDVYDVAYLITADGDQAPTVRLLKQRFAATANRPAKRLITVAPPERKHNFKIRDEAHSHQSISIPQLECEVDPIGWTGTGVT
jgi:uncharacterized LabA/DUF88 family protein